MAARQAQMGNRTAPSPRPLSTGLDLIDVGPSLMITVIVVINPFVVGQLTELSRLATAYLLAFDLTCALAITLLIVAGRQRTCHARAFAITWVASIPLQLASFEVAVFYHQVYLESREVIAAESGGSLHRSDHRLGWVPRAGATVRHRSPGNFDVTCHIDQGGRRTHGPGTTGGATKVHLFGDSFTFGHGVEDHETYAARLRDQWIGVDIVNHGVAGYGPEQMYLRLVDAASEVRPGDLVVFAPISGDLPRSFVDRRFLCGLVASQVVPVESVPVLADHGVVPVDVVHRCGALDVFMARSRLPMGRLGSWIVDRMRRDQVIDNADQVFRLARKLTETRGASFLLVFLARPAECLNRRHHFDLAELSTPHQSLLGACPEDRETVLSHRFPADGHWTAGGHRWAADRLAEILTQRLVAVRAARIH